MIDDQVAIPQMAEPNWGEAVLQTIHNATAISSIPVIAPAICSLLSSRIQSLGQKRFNEFMIEFVVYIKDLNSNILESNDFIVATEMTLNKIVNEQNQKKRKRFAKMYRNFIQEIDSDEESLDIDRLELFLSIVKILSDNALHSLLMLKKSGLYEPFSADSDMSNKFKIFNKQAKQKCGEHYYYRAMAELEQTGVATQASGFWGGNVPFVTQLGLDFIKWIESDNE